MPIVSVLSQMNLANALFIRKKGDQKKNIDSAIATYEQALQVIDQETMPFDWANIMHNLGNAYLLALQKLEA